MPVKSSGDTASLPKAADRLREMREGLRISQTRAAEAIGIHVTTYRQYETSRRNATLEQLHRFATALGGDPHRLDRRLASNKAVG